MTSMHNSLVRDVESACRCTEHACDQMIFVPGFLHRRGIAPTGRSSICGGCLEADHAYPTEEGPRRESDLKAWSRLSTADRLTAQLAATQARRPAEAHQAALDAQELRAAKKARSRELWRARMTDQVAMDVGRWRTLPGLDGPSLGLVRGFVEQAAAVIHGDSSSVPTLIIHGAPGSGRTTLAHAIVDGLVQAGAVWPQEVLIEREDRVTSGVVDGHQWERGKAMASLIDPFTAGQIKVAVLDDVGKGARLTDHTKSQAVMDQLSDAISQARTPLVITTGLNPEGRAARRPDPGMFLADYLDPSAYTRIMRHQHTVNLGGTS